MSTEEQLEKFYNTVINAAVALNSQWLFNHGNFNNQSLIEARERLRGICNANSLSMVIIPDGDDAVLVIKTEEKELVLQIVMNKMTYLDDEKGVEYGC
jgi:hypothetical protein